MIFVTRPDSPKKVSEVCLALSEILLSTALHDELDKFKSILPGSNIDGPTLSSEIFRTLDPYKRPSIAVETYWWLWGEGSVEGETIFINTKNIGGKDGMVLARTIASLAVCVVDRRSAFWFDGSIYPLFRSVPTAHTIVGDLASRLYKFKERKIKGVHDYGTEVGTAEARPHHFID